MSNKIGLNLPKSEYNKRYYTANNPFPIRLGELKSKLHKDAFEQDKSITEVLKKIVADHYEQKEKSLNEMSLKEIMEPLSRLK